jgi:hypothetical protein
MKTLFLSLASILTLALGGCATEDSFAPEQESGGYRSSAPDSPDPTRHIPSRPTGASSRY